MSDCDCFVYSDTCFDDDNYNFYEDTCSQYVYKNLFQELELTYGIPVKLIPATVDRTNDDKLFGENRKITFEKAISIKIFFEEYDAYDDNGNVFQKFGLQFDNELKCSISKLTVEGLDQDIGEGDIIYIPMVDGLFEIKYIDRQNSPFYLMGIPMNYKLTLIKYRHDVEEDFDETGINDQDIVDILNQTNYNETNNDLDELAEDITDNSDEDENNSIFGDWQ